MEEADKRKPVAVFSQKAAILDAYIDDQGKDGKQTYRQLRKIFKLV